MFVFSYFPVALQLCSEQLTAPQQVELHAALGLCSDVANHKFVPTSEERQGNRLFTPRAGVPVAASLVTTETTFHYRHTASFRGAVEPNAGTKYMTLFRLHRRHIIPCRSYKGTRVQLRSAAQECSMKQMLLIKGLVHFC